MKDTILGSSVTVMVDRPIGSVHPKHKDIFYSVNYGYIPGILAPDGEEQDAYILGVNKPVTQYKGIVIAVIHRENDVEDKWVVAPDSLRLDQAQIMEAVHFQEQYFKTTIQNLYQKSCGVIVYRRSAGKVEYLLLFQHKSRTWSFPKGHMEPFEDAFQTAVRELQEETGLAAVPVADFQEEITYTVSLKCEKTVVLFLGETKEDVKIKTDEIEEFRWTDKEKAVALLKNSGYLAILEKAEKVIFNESSPITH